MKTKPVLPLVVSMSLPMVVSMLVGALYNIVDSFFVAKISEDAMSALSLIFPIQNALTAIAVGLGVGVNAVISFYLGTQNSLRADTAATKGLMLSAVHGVVLAITSVVITPVFLSFFTDNQTIIEIGSQYAAVAFTFTFFNQIAITMEKIFQAVGKMSITMVVLGSGCIANIILDPLMIFGIGPFPAMGIKGAALATGIGQTLTFVMYFVIYFSKEFAFHLKPSLLREKGDIKKLYSIGIPATLNMALPSLLISALNAILAAYSGIYIVILGIYYKLQTFVYLPANGIIQGIRPIAGYNYGAKEHDRINKVYRTTLGLMIGIMIIGTMLCIFFPHQIMGLFSQNKTTIAEGATALRIISIGFIISSISLTASGMLEGLGMGMPSLKIMLLRYIVLIIPLAFVLSRFMGPSGVWHAFWITEFITAYLAHKIYKKSFVLE